jgi:uncharacterized protein (DUF736 family)
MYDDTNKGVLFQNSDKKTDKHPDYTGKLNVNGVEFRLAGWKRLSKNGKPFLSLAVSEPQDKEVVAEVTDEPINLNDIPF